MEQEIQQLRAELRAEIQQLRDMYAQQVHNGIDGGLVDFSYLTGSIKTITSAADLTNALAFKPTNVRDQILIDTTTGTKKLYIYDAVGKVWRSCTIA